MIDYELMVKRGAIALALNSYNRASQAFGRPMVSELPSSYNWSKYCDDASAVIDALGLPTCAKGPTRLARSNGGASALNSPTRPARGRRVSAGLQRVKDWFGGGWMSR